MKQHLLLIKKAGSQRRLLLLMVFSLLFNGLMAQRATVSGTVTSSEDNSAIPGVNVIIKGTSEGTTTDIDGQYTLQVSGTDATLVFSSVGYIAQEVLVGNQTMVNVTMEPDVQQLSEIVVTALGIEREEKSLTYAQQSVDGEELMEARDINFLNSLNGRAAGVQIAKSSSGAGGSTRIVLRGNKSLSGNSEPLFVIDGIPMANNKTGQPGMWGGTDGGDGMSQLNPDDIESISILRGSNAAALYGSQGANGVVLITTKKGKQGSAKVSISTGVTFENVMKMPELQFKYGAKGAAKESWDDTPGDYESGYVDDWFQTGTNFINSLTISGGGERTTAYFSYGNLSATGITPTNKYNRNNFMFKQSTKLFNDKVTVSSNVMVSDEKTDNRMAAGYYLNPLTGLYMFPRNGATPEFNRDVGRQPFSYYKENYQFFSTSRNMDVMNWFVTDHHQSNPYWILNRQPREDRTKRIIASMDINYQITDNLSFSVRGNYDYADKKFERQHAGTSNTTNVHPNGSWEYSKYTDELAYTDGILRYNDNFGDFSLDLVAGGSYQKTVYGKGVSVPASANDGLVYPNQFYFQNLQPIVQVQSTLGSQLIKQALFANAAVGWKDMLFLDLSGRNDWASSLAGTGNDSYFYPMYGLSWIISETFNMPGFINFAKVRASSSTVGNEVPFNRVNPQNTINRSLAISRNDTAPFDNLKPELIKSQELGLNMRFWDERLGFDFTYYNIESTDQFIQLPAPSGSEFSTYFVNAGLIVNKGVELTLDVTPILTNNFNWTTTFNYSRNRNEVVETHPDLTNPINTGASEGYVSRFEEGGMIGDVFVYKYRRDDQGRILLDNDDRPLKTQLPEYAGNLNPDFILGWNNSFEMGNFGLNFLIVGKFGGVAFSQTESMLDGAGVSQRTADARDAGGVFGDFIRESDGAPVSSVDPETWYRAIGDRNGVGESYVYDRTNIRLSQFAFSYNFSWSKRAFPTTLSLVGQNLFFLRVDAPFDPDLAMNTTRNSESLDNFNLPVTRTIGVNLKVTF
jgi:TonB-linked SusC/RagA family outer membrane protein